MISGPCYVMLVLIGGSLSAITSSPGIKRVYEGDSSVFQWAFTGPAINYYFQNLSTSPPSNVRGTSVINPSTGVITLTITNVALWDAGNYSLIVDNTNDTTALLYIYRNLVTPYVYDFGYVRQFPVVEQKSIWIECSASINSRPATYAPQVLYTFQRDGQQISNQLDRHNISGNRLTINPVLREDDGRLYRCKAQEIGSKLESNYSEVFNLSLHEFKSVPLEFQRVNEQKDLSLNWEMSYDIFNFLDDHLYWGSLYIDLSRYGLGMVARNILYDRSWYYSTVTATFRTRATLTVDKNIITFYMANILTSDAGYFTLTLSYEPSDSIQQNTTALFVYGYPSLGITKSPDYSVVPTASSIELTCTANSTSLPAIYRQTMNYNWGFLENNHIAQFEVRSDGSVALEDGTAVGRYSLTNNNRTLRIASVSYFDNKDFLCIATESGSEKQNWNSLYLNIMYAPVIASTMPLTRKVNVIAPKLVYLRVTYNANPFPETTPTWRFVNITGADLSLPVSAVYDWNSVRFILSTMSQYGSYICRVNNTYGATEATFEVLPPAKPDKPINFLTYYLTSTSAFLQWNCSWDNGMQQFFIVQLNETASGSLIETKNITSPIGCLSNVTFLVKFETNIEEETDYKASLWSYNERGSSDVIELTFRTLARPTLLVPAEDIILNGTSAVISYSIEKGRAVQLKVECCVEPNLVCVSSFFNVNAQENTITLTNIPPDGSQYTFDFYLYDGPSLNYSLVAFVKNVVKYDDNKGASNGSLLAAVVVLATLLGLSIALIIGLMIAFVRIRRSKTPVQRTQRQNDCPIRDGVVNSAMEDPVPNGAAIPAIYEGLAERDRYQEPRQMTYETLRLESKPKERKKFQKH